MIVVRNVAYIQPVSKCHQLLLEHINYGLLSLVAIGNVNSITASTGCYVDHILIRLVFEGFDRLRFT